MNNSQEIKALVSIRTGVRSKITKVKKKLEECLNKIPFNEGDNQDRLDCHVAYAETCLEEADTLHKQMLEVARADESISDEETAKMADKNDDSLEPLNIVLAKVRRMRRELQARPASETAASVSNSSHRSVRIKLPTLDLLEFSGNVLDYTAFTQSFRAVHDNEELEPYEKFQYLQSKLKGAARNALAGFAPTNEAYPQAMEMLEKLYGNKDIIKMAHLNALDDLPSPTESVSSLQEYRHKVETNLCHLKTAGIDSNDCANCSFMMAHRINRKLPSRIQEACSRGRDPNAAWTLTDLRDALLSEITRLQKCETGFKPQANEVRKPNHQGSSRSNGHSRSSNGNVQGPRSTVSNFQVGTSGCAFCADDHSVYRCTNYDTHDERKARVSELRLCFKCLKVGHVSADCPEKAPFCSNCKITGHHGALCFKRSKGRRKEDKPAGNDAKSTAAVATSSSANKTTSVATVNALAAGCGKATALPTAMVSLRTKDGTKLVRALFDQGAQRSFIKRGVLSNDDTACQQTTLTIDGFNSKGTEAQYDIATVSIDVPTQEAISIDVIVVDTLAERLNMSGIQKIAKKLEAKGHNLADNFSNTVHYPVDMLIGADHYYDFVYPEQKDEGIMIIPSKLGDLLSGPIQEIQSNTQVSVITALKVAVSNKAPEKDVDLLWRLDAIGISPDEAHPDDKAALHQFNESIRYSEGKYVARLPWKAAHPTLPINYRLAQGRLISNLKRLRSEPDLLSHYDNVIVEQLQKGFIERVSDMKPPEVCHYLPHHAVRKESLTTPLRVVFDCSAKPNNLAVSLNDCLYPGPSMVPELPQMLMRFRLGSLAACSDIAKAFLMVGLDEQDRDFTRFLWPRDPKDPDSPIDTYRFKVILFGATCSQFILNATIDHHLEKYGEQRDITEKIKRNIYVDNLLVTASTKTELQEFHSSSKKILGDAGLNLREWATNDPDLKELTQKEGESDVRSTVPVLGLRWDTVQDTLTVAPKELESGKPTKRIILRGLATQFDPLGLMTPITIKAKFLMKEIWQSKVDWDDDLPEATAAKWEKIKKEFSKMGDIPVQRNSGIGKSMTLHTFVDASTVAYGAVVYGVSEGKATLLMAKGRIAPEKTLSVPRLELTAALLGARLTKYVCDAYEHEVTVEAIHMWSDSQVALGWIHSAGSLEAYMQNRKVDIKRILPNANWHYVHTSQNPADLITRGVSPKKLISNHLWWHGPKNIVELREWENFPAQVHTVALAEEVPPPESFLLSVAKKCSTFKKLITTFGWVKRFVECLKRVVSNPGKVKEHGKKQVENLTLKEMEWSEDWVVKELQRESFADEIKFICKPTPKGSTPLTKQLNIRLRDDKLVVVSRITEAEVEDAVKYPVLLPTKHRITNQIVEEMHQRKHHMGINHVVASLRQRWWIPRVRQKVKHVIKQCMKCRRERGTHFRAPPTPPLPGYRVSQSRPFAVTGVDYAGPLHVKEGTRIEKRYIALYTCASTRAVHLEVAQDLSAEAFLRTLQRFSARRSYPQMLISDNGSNFVSSAKILKSWEENHRVRSTLNQNKCKWHFNPSRAPWFGGFFERIVKMVKLCLQKTLQRTMVTEDELHTVLCEIEADLNDRPLTSISDSVDDHQPLTPSQLMLGHRLDSVPVAILDPEEEFDPSMFTAELLTRRQRNVQRVLHHFQTRFRKEYLTILRHHATEAGEIVAPKVGDIVQIHDEGPRLLWNLGRI